MATKTISLDIEAYERLREAKQPEESFSEAIKRLVPRAFDVEAWLSKLDRDPLDPKTVEAVEQAVAGRSSRPRSSH